MQIDAHLVLLLAKIDMGHPNEPMYLINSEINKLPFANLRDYKISIEDLVNELIFNIFNFKTKWLGKSQIPLKKVKDRMITGLDCSESLEKEINIVYGTIILVDAKPQEPFKWISFTEILEDEKFDKYELEIINEVGQIL